MIRKELARLNRIIPADNQSQDGDNDEDKDQGDENEADSDLNSYDIAKGHEHSKNDDTETEEAQLEMLGILSNVPKKISANTLPETINTNIQAT